MSTIMAVSLNSESKHFLLQLLSSLLSSPLFSSLIFPLLSAATLYWHVFCALVPSFSLALDNEVVAVSGCLFCFFLCLCSTSPWKPKKTKQNKQLLLSFCAQDMPSILCQAQNVGLSLRLYWSVKKPRCEWMLLFDVFCYCFRCP